MTCHIGHGDYVLIMPNGKFVLKGDGTNCFVGKPCDATQFPDKEIAESAKPGHHRDMGGNGFKGSIVTYEESES